MQTTSVEKKKKNCLSLLSWCSVHLRVQIDCVYVQCHVLGYGGVSVDNDSKDL